MFASQEGGKEAKDPSPSDIVDADLSLSQAARVGSIQAAYRRHEAANPRDNAPKAGAIRNLGLLDKEEDTKSVLGTK